MYRDGMFYLCLAFMNGAVGPAEFARSSAALLTSAEKLITTEIPELAKTNQQKQANSTPTKATIAPGGTIQIGNHTFTLSVSETPPASSSKEKSSLTEEKSPPQTAPK
jgi:hypothetical protein